MASIKRKQVRELKRLASTSGSAVALLALLDRSIKFGHKRLALRRWFEAEKQGVMVPQASRDYCERLMEAMPAEVIRNLCLQSGLLDSQGRLAEFNAMVSG